jgi:hypothetical protein
MGDRDTRSLAALILGDSSAFATDARGARVFCDLAEHHGVLPLAGEPRPLACLPSDWRATIRDRIHRGAAADLVRQHELTRLLAALQGAEVRPLLIKGAHLAYRVYPRPDLRPRIDTDLLVSPEQTGRADGVLRALGYTQVPQVAADLVMYQQPYEKHHDGGVAHTVDLHWRFANPQRFGAVVTYADLLERSARVPGLSDTALGPGLVDALIIACVHRIAHHLEQPRLIWSYDIHLLAGAFDDNTWFEVASTASRHRVSLACQRGLEAAIDHFQTRVPATVLTSLADAASGEPPMEAYLDGRQPHIARILSDFRAMDSWAAALRLARQHALPSPTYMREVYAPSSHAPLPWLYARRAWRGARRWLARP